MYVDYISASGHAPAFASACQHFSTLRPSGFAFQYAAQQNAC
jgi:hypothetical protein